MPLLPLLLCTSVPLSTAATGPDWRNASSQAEQAKGAGTPRNPKCLLPSVRLGGVWVRIPSAPAQGTAGPWPFGTSRPPPPLSAASLLAPLLSGPGLRAPVRREASLFSPKLRPLPLLVPLQTQFPQDPCPTAPASPGAPCWGIGERALIGWGVPVALPPPLSVPLLHCFWG